MPGAKIQICSKYHYWSKVEPEPVFQSSWYDFCQPISK